MKRMGKCLFAWDGSTDGRTNNGCGPIHDCTGNTSDARCANKQCAYSDLQPPNYNTVVDPKSDYVKNDLCVNKKQLPEEGKGSDCYWKGPAFDTVNDDAE